MHLSTILAGSYRPLINKWSDKLFVKYILHYLEFLVNVNLFFISSSNLSIISLEHLTLPIISYSFTGKKILSFEIVVIKLQQAKELSLNIVT